MIIIECDNCERTFEARESDTGSKVACPYCGDINRVPESAASAPADPNRATALPEGELPPDHGPEQHICHVRPAMFRAHPFRALFIAILFIGGIVLAILAYRAEQSPWNSQWMVYAALLPTVFAIGWIIKWSVFTRWWVRLSISNKRTVREEGIITRSTSEVMHDHVRNVEIHQSFLQRILDVGYMGISSAGQDDIEIRVNDVPSPYKVKAIIDKYREM